MKHLAHVIQLYYLYPNIGWPCGYYCGFRKLHCANKIQCIVQLDCCDGEVHWKDGSDEDDDFCRSTLQEYHLQWLYFDVIQARQLRKVENTKLAIRTRKWPKIKQGLTEKTDIQEKATHKTNV